MKFSGAFSGCWNCILFTSLCFQFSHSGNLFYSALVEGILQKYLSLADCFIFPYNVLFAEVILQWVLEPNNPSEAVEGDNITLKWDYNLTGDTIDRVQWRDVKNSEAIGKLSSSGPVVYPDYITRFKIDENEKATLMIFDVKRRDTGKYKCEVDVKLSDQKISSEIQLNVLCK